MGAYGGYPHQNKGAGQMRIRGLLWVLRDRKTEGLHVTEGGLRRSREAEAAQLVREQRAELARQRAERETRES
jgi:hypothetical protein